MPGYRTGGTESESGDHYLDRGELTPVTERLVHPDQAGISDMESHGVTWSHMEMTPVTGRLVHPDQAGISDMGLSVSQ